MDSRMTMQKDTKGLQTAVRAAQALSCFSEREPELTVSHLSELLRVPPSTAYRLLASLVLGGLVEQDPDTKRYRLSLLMFILGNTVINRVGFNGREGSALQALADACGETVNLGVRIGRTVVYVRKVDSAEVLRADLRIGSRLPLHCTAVGKVLLAFLGDEERRAVLNAYPFHQSTPRTIVDPERLERELELIRARGIAIDNEEFQLGIRCMACPVRGPTGHVIAALGIGAPSTRLSEARIRELEPTLREQAARISRSLGCPEESPFGASAAADYAAQGADGMLTHGA